MPRPKPKPHELTTEQAIRKMFPPEVRSDAKREGQKARKSGAKAAIPKKDS
jgi:hypothetical protein